MGVGRAVRGAMIEAMLGERALRAQRRLRQVGRTLRRSARRAELYFQVDDPYSYLLVQLVPALRAQAGLEVELVVVPPGAVDVDPEPQLRALYAARDAALLARYYRLDFPQDWVAPPPDRVRRVAAVLLATRSVDAQLEAARVLGAALWRGDGDALARAVNELGAVAGQDVSPTLEANYARLRARGHYMGGMLAYGGEWYWGVDRIDHLAERLRAEGCEITGGALLAPRAPEELPMVGRLARPGERPRLELFFSFRSPYSYLCLARVRALVERHDLELVIRPVLPMVMRGLPVPRAKQLYIVRDAKREAARYGVPFGRLCDPLGAGVERCLAVYVVAERLGLGLPFVESAARGIWSEAVDVATDDGLRKVTERAGIPWEQARDGLEDPAFAAMAEDNRRALFELGLWGVPSLRLGDLAVWGQDRLPILEALLAG